MKKENPSIRVNRFIAMCGICSRRKADLLIENGRVKINGNTISALGTKVSDKDVVEVDGKKISIEKKRYILLNKPKGYITTMSDERGRKTVLSLIQDSYKERLVPVGRLDRNTTGLLLFTNDGLLAKKLMHPKYQIKKIYNVELNRDLCKQDFDAIMNNLTLSDGVVIVDSLEYCGSNNKLRIEIHIGRNRIIRRIFEHLGYNVEKLDRVEYACLSKKNLLLGKWRVLTNFELKELSRIS